MKIEPIPEVEHLELKLPVKLMRDYFSFSHERGQGYSKREQQEI